MTNHSDVIDCACAQEQQFRERAISSIVNRKQALSNGICADCHFAIPASRLKANPYALRCIECQSEYEFKQKKGLYD